MDSKRVRKAHALDAIEELIVKQCGDSVRETIRTTNHIQVRLQFHIVGAIRDASAKYGVPFDELWQETCSMMRDELGSAIGALGRDEWIRPYKEAGETVGFEVNFYMGKRRAA